MANTNKITVNKKELFEKALQATDRYNKAIEIGATIFEELFDLIAKDFYAEIVANGWKDEYWEYALTGGEM